MLYTLHEVCKWAYYMLFSITASAKLITKNAMWYFKNSVV